MGGLLNVNKKVPLYYNGGKELIKDGTEWIHLITINKSDPYTRSSSLLEVQFGGYDTFNQTILLLGIAHSITHTPYKIAMGVRQNSTANAKIAYYKSPDNKTSIYIKVPNTYISIGTIWITKFFYLDIDSETLSAISSLPEGSVEIQL